MFAVSSGAVPAARVFFQEYLKAATVAYSLYSALDRSLRSEAEVENCTSQ